MRHRGIAAACTSHNPTTRHDFVLAKLERSVRAVLGSKYEVVVEHAMNALLRRPFAAWRSRPAGRNTEAGTSFPLGHGSNSVHNCT
jgi:hypothetical protein